MRILVVEDERMLAQALAPALKAQHYVSSKRQQARESLLREQTENFIWWSVGGRQPTDYGRHFAADRRFLDLSTRVVGPMPNQVIDWIRVQLPGKGCRSSWTNRHVDASVCSWD